MLLSVILNSMNENLLGNKYGRLLVIAAAGKDERRNRLWKCKCDCGNITVTRGSNLKTGMTASCGCLLKDSPGRLRTYRRVRKLKTTHGMSRTPTWVSWGAMMQRCTNPKREEYPNYGGRGIAPCDFIKESPANLVAVIGKRPKSCPTLERIDNSVGYNCGQCDQCKANGWKLNVRWATRIEQSRNKRNNFWIMHNGVKKLRKDLAAELGVTIGYIRAHYG